MQVVYTEEEKKIKEKKWYFRQNMPLVHLVHNMNCIMRTWTNKIRFVIDNDKTATLMNSYSVLYSHFSLSVQWILFLLIQSSKKYEKETSFLVAVLITFISIENEISQKIQFIWWNWKGWIWPIFWINKKPEIRIISNFLEYVA